MDSESSLKKHGVALKKAVKRRDEGLSTFSANAAGQLDIFRHDGDPLGVDGTEVSVLEQTDQIRFSSFLEGHDGRRLEAEVSLEVLGDLTN